VSSKLYEVLPHEYFHISLYLQCFKGMYLNDDLYSFIYNK
jgi:hypothetical protein